MFNKFLPMTGFEPRTSGIGSDHSTNWATTTAPISQQIFVQYNWVQWRELYKRYNASECKTSNVQFSLVNTDRLSYKSFNCFFHVEINFIFSLSITHSLSLSLSLSFEKWKLLFSDRATNLSVSLLTPQSTPSLSSSSSSCERYFYGFGHQNFWPFLSLFIKNWNS